MKPIGHIPNFPKMKDGLNSHESVYTELLLKKAKLVADPTQLLKLRQKFLIYEDNFKGTVAQAIGNRLSFADLCRVCSKYDQKGMDQHQTKSAETMQYFIDKGLRPDAAQACALALAWLSFSKSKT